MDCRATQNGGSGIIANGGVISNSMVTFNGAHGLIGFGSVIAFCRASNNNLANNGSVDIFESNAARTGNLPAP